MMHPKRRLNRLIFTYRVAEKIEVILNSFNAKVFANTRANTAIGQPEWSTQH